MGSIGYDKYMEEKRIKIGINGLGRIGTVVLRAVLQEKYPIDIVAINTKGNYDAQTISMRLKYDSVYGHFPEPISHTTDQLSYSGQTIALLTGDDSSAIPWGTHGVDVVLECTGKFTDKKAEGHFTGGAKKVIISAPSKDPAIPTYILGVNEKKYHGETVISNGSCTTNCVAPIMKLLHEQIGIEKGMLTTVHAYTANQNLVDGSSKDPRRGRAATTNIVPTTTGAAEAVIACYPEMRGKFDGIAIRVPVICGSYSAITCKMVRKTTKEEINAMFEKASMSTELRGKLLVSHDPLVSSDIIGNSASCVVDAQITSVISDDMISIGAWYDNEYGYACRLIEMAMYIGR
ncbi:MAG: Glyceraldehyde-3-phosphate dehydrogenase [Microgenomates group bacterium GW2011_GWC1_39_12]|nr:MAG: Glyceraldehyde-3-phosphate dehydrogenase [Microgenomates group bacterium GW2011_GWC1_39_12]